MTAPARTALDYNLTDRPLCHVLALWSFMMLDIALLNSQVGTCLLATLFNVF